MKKSLKSIIAAAAALCMALAAAVPAFAASVTATPTSSTVLVDNKQIAFEAYTIGGNNYFKLRDIATSLVSKPTHFSVDWDGASNSILLSTLDYYVPQGGELTASGNTSPVQAVPNASKIFLNGEQIELTAYTINGYNYFKLRDIGAAIDFGVNYDGKTDTIKIDTSAGYLISGILGVLDGAYYGRAANVVSYTGTDTGSIQINFPDNTTYIITAVNISSDNDYAKIKDVLALFVGDPDQVITALKASKTGGRKELQLDGKNVTCYVSGAEQTVTIKW